PLQEDALLPGLDTRPPLLREHRLYQADWLLRFYGFEAKEIIDPEKPMLHPEVDPKCSWAVSHLDDFPVEVNTADYEMLLRVPGIGVTGAKRIVRARRNQRLDFDMLKRLGVVLKRARWFITCGGKTMQKIPETPEMMIWSILSPNRMGGFTDYGMEQLSLFEPVLTGEDFRECLTGEF
ncbi:MAG: helix-hairpin-helix domain-containing protein, partial [Oscillospiraceae bacterium]|nr:helix-hairpin-helix domain-containing protein [Oscillospiraceae bacterium]